MKTNISKSYKFFVAVIALVLLCTVAFGASKAFAEPPLKDRIEILGTGKFQPSELYDDGIVDRNDSEVNIIGWLETTELMFSESLWTDYNNDGTIELNDVYLQEEVTVVDAISRESGYPILDIGKNDYYIVPFVNYLQFDEAVITQFQLSHNNDNASLVEKNTYWFDNNTCILYIRKDLVDNNYANDDLDIRAELVQIVEDIDTTTKQLGLFTTFNEDIDNTYGLYSTTPNEVSHQVFKDWHFYGLEYTLIPPEKLAYVSASNLEVYINGNIIEDDAWYYDETNGKIHINCNAYTTEYIIVQINKLNTPNSSQIALQSLQSGNMGQAGANDLPVLKEKMGNMQNLFLKNITFTEEPHVGDYDQCNSTASVSYYNGSIGKVSGLGNALGTLCDTGLIKTECKKILDNNPVWKGNYVASGTLSMQNGHLYDMGAISYNLALSEYYKRAGDINNQNKYMADALNATETYLADHSGGFRSDWYVPMSSTDYKSNREVYISGRTGTLSTTFLGGTINNEVDGYALFDMSCCFMAKPFSNNVVNNGTFIDWNQSGDNWWCAECTIVDINESTKELIVCAWSAAWHEPKADTHNQKVLGFSRIHYTFDSNGFVHFSKLNEDGEHLPGAVYLIKGVTDTTFEQTVTSTDSYVEVELPIGKYTLTEVTPPLGYIKNTTPVTFEVTANHSEPNTAYQLVVKDEKQKVNCTLTVYDKASVANNVDKNRWQPLKDVQFSLYTEGGKPVPECANLKTNDNGVITFSFDALNGNHYLIQTGTIDGYVIDEHCKKIIPINGTWADTTGEHKTWSAEHYEPRQRGQIISQVIDYDLHENGKGITTPAVFDRELIPEKNAGYVETKNAEYQLITQEDIFLGYRNKNDPIIIESGTALTICDDPASLPNDWDADLNTLKRDYHSYKSASNFNATTQIKSKENDDGTHAYVSAYTVAYEGKMYPLPNGQYKWKLVSPSNGYTLPEKATSNYQTRFTDISLPWGGYDTEIVCIEKDDPVFEVRQRISIKLFVKYYEKDGRLALKEHVESVYANEWITLKEDAPAGSANRLGQDGGLEGRKSITKTMLSTSAIPTKTSTERAIVKQKGDTVLTVQSKGMVANSVYELIAVERIIDIESGKSIEAGTILGKFLVTDANNEGTITLKSMGTNEFVSSTGNQINTVVVKALDGTVCTSELPNGVYELKCIGLPAGYNKELAVADDIVITANWDKNQTQLGTRNTTTTTMLYKTPEEVQPEPVVAPDPTEDTTPDDSTPDDIPDQIDLPEDPTQIPIVDIDWVDDNQFNIAYRITDTVNIIQHDNGITYEVQDKLPTTFAFYMNNDFVRDIDPNLQFETYTYEVAYYYEISAAEYENALKNADTDTSDTIDIEKTYIKLGNNVYAKKFEMNDSTKDDYIHQHIKLNPNSPGYNGSITSMKHNATISGALCNTVWLNKQLTKQTDHQFNVYIVTKTTVWIESFDGQLYDHPQPERLGILKIKQRELINLD